MVILVLVSMLLAAISSRHITREERKTTLYQSNTTLFLFDGDDYALHSLTVTQDSDHPGNFDHNIILYQHKSKCSNLPILNTSNTVAGSDFSTISEIPIYALAGSSMTFNICGSTNSTYPIERLELVLNYGLEALQSLSQDYHNFSYFLPGTGGEWTCKKVTFHLNKDGYYTTRFLTKPTSAIFNYSVTFFHQQIDVEVLQEYLVHTDTLFMDRDHKVYTENNYCHIAVIQGKPGVTKTYVHIQLTYKYYTMKFFANNFKSIILLTSIFIILIILGVGSALLIRKYRCLLGHVISHIVDCKQK